METETGAATTGGCLCGAVRYRLSQTPAGYGACHCGMCQRWAAGVFLAVEVPPDGAEWQGEPPRIYASSDWAERGFCGQCGATLFWRMTAPGPQRGMMYLSAGTLDRLGGLSLTGEIFIDHKPAGHGFAGAHPRMTDAEVMAAAGINEA